MSTYRLAELYRVTSLGCGILSAGLRKKDLKRALLYAGEKTWGAGEGVGARGSGVIRRFRGKLRGTGKTILYFNSPFFAVCFSLSRGSLFSARYAASMPTNRL